MSVADSNDIPAVMPRSAPFAFPAHPIMSVDRAMQRAQPMFHFPLPTARASTATAGRGKCCSTPGALNPPVRFVSRRREVHILEWLCPPP
jgi:hypothetical protein